MLGSSAATTPRGTAAQRLDQRPDDRPTAADDDHDDHEHGDADVEESLGIDRHLLEGVCRSHQSGEEARQREGRHLGPGRVDADRGGRVLVLVDRPQRITELPARPVARRRGRTRRGGGRGHRSRRCRGGPWARHPHRRQRDASAAAGQVRQVDDDLPGPLPPCRGSRWRSSGHAAAAAAADQRAPGRGGEPADDEADPETHVGMSHQHGGDVAAEPEEDDLPERGIAGEPR